MIKATNQVLFVLLLLIMAGCGGRGSSKKNQDTAIDTTSVPDTGFTGIKQYFSQEVLVKEATFKNGILHGETKTYYRGGQLNQTFWYENGMREDSARKYYLEGQVFRSTPYRHDTVHGTQVQYYRSGSVRARLNFYKGLRTPELEEYDRNGRLQKNYPEIVYSVNDNYSASGKVRINLGISDEKRRVKFYRGEFTNGVFDTAVCKLIPAINDLTFIDLRKSGTPQSDYVDVIAAIVTDFGNNYLTYKKIPLPYNDLK